MPEPGDATQGADAPLAVVLEGLLFVAGAPVSVADLARALDVGRPRVEEALRELAASYRERGVRLQRTNGHVQLASAPEAARAIERFLGLGATTRLSPAALETLSIVAYRQPVTRPEIDDVRGVDSDGVLRTLLARGLVEQVGQRLTVGHPIEYGTTFLFLEFFGLSSIDDLVPSAAETELPALPHAPPANGGPPATVPVMPAFAQPELALGDRVVEMAVAGGSDG